MPGQPEGTAAAGAVTEIVRRSRSLRANHADERTADPVELERRLLALEGDNAEPGTARRSSGWTLSRKLAVAFELSTAEDIDLEVRAWLREAYELAGGQ